MVLDDGTGAPRKDRPRGSKEANEDKGTEARGSESFKTRDHNIDEVKAYVGENPDRLDDVLADEKKGENRKTLVEWLKSQKDESGS